MTTTATTAMVYIDALDHQKSDRLDPETDDVATPGVDLSARAFGFRRSGLNPFVIG